MQQLIELIGSSVLTAHRGTQAGQRSQNHRYNKLNRGAGLEGELVLLGFDGTVFAREVNSRRRDHKI
jgi:hypothetical protein